MRAGEAGGGPGLPRPARPSGHAPAARRTRAAARRRRPRRVALPAAHEQAAPAQDAAASRAAARRARERERASRLRPRRRAARCRARGRPARARAAPPRRSSKRPQRPALVAPLGRQRAHAQRDARDHAEHALGARSRARAATARPRSPARPAVAQLAGRRRAAQRDHVRVDPPVAGRRLAGRARRHAAADASPTRSSAGTWPSVRPRSASARSASGSRMPGSSTRGERALVERPSTRSIRPRSSETSASNGPRSGSQAADDARAAAERHDRDARLRAGLAAPPAPARGGRRDDRVGRVLAVARALARAGRGRTCRGSAARAPRGRRARPSPTIASSRARAARGQRGLAQAHVLERHRPRHHGALDAELGAQEARRVVGQRRPAPGSPQPQKTCSRRLTRQHQAGQPGQRLVAPGAGGALAASCRRSAPSPRGCCAQLERHLGARRRRRAQARPRTATSRNISSNGVPASSCDQRRGAPPPSTARPGSRRAPRGRGAGRRTDVQPPRAHALDALACAATSAAGGGGRGPIVHTSSSRRGHACASGGRPSLRRRRRRARGRRSPSSRSRPPRNASSTRNAQPTTSAPSALDQLGQRPRRAAGGEQVVVQQHARAVGQRVGVHLQRVDAVLEDVLGRDRLRAAACRACARARSRRRARARARRRG